MPVKRSWLVPVFVGTLILADRGFSQPPEAAAQQEDGPTASADASVKLMTLDPGHFHAGLIQQEMYPNVSEVVHVYAPLGPDLFGHLNRIAQFNNRSDNPTRWQLEIHTTSEPLERMLAEHPGNVVVLSGRNQGKIDYILRSVEAGLHVLADKPWIISAGDFSKLEASIDTAERDGVVAYDVMTERYEITTILQRELVHDEAITGEIVPGTPEEPAVQLESVHHLMKTVAGVPNLRPTWFFDTAQQGEALADVGTHLVDLVPWVLFPEQAIDYRKDIKLDSAKRWPTLISAADFRRVTGAEDFPSFLAADVKDGQLQYFSNTEVSYALRGVHARVKVAWNFEAPPGAGDTHLSVVRGSKSRIEVRQGAEEKYRPELYVVPGSDADRANVVAAVKARVAELQSRFPGVAVDETGEGIHLSVPDKYRTGHESHFAEVTRQFLEYVGAPETVPAWEKANMLAKYYVTTEGVELSRQGGDRSAGR
ncbi:MAG: oxidoreductase [Luteitalea sp.]|nr:oxidoreductase [Luteitalea sp.]